MDHIKSPPHHFLPIAKQNRSPAPFPDITEASLFGSPGKHHRSPTVTKKTTPSSRQSHLLCFKTSTPPRSSDYTTPPRSSDYTTPPRDYYSQETPDSSSKEYQVLQGLPKEIQRELYKDIEEAGGRNSISLNRLCDRRPDIYGQPGTSRRKQVSNKVQWSKRLSNQDYNQYLLDLGVEPSSSRRDSRSKSKVQHLSPVPHEAETIDQLLSDFSGLNLKNSEMSASKAIITRPGFRHLHNDEEEGSLKAGTFSIKQPQLIIGYFLTLLLHAADEIRDVDCINSERNWPFKIFFFRDVEKDGILRNGVMIMLEADLRDIITDRFKATQVTANEISIEVPSMSAAMLHDTKGTVEAMKHFNNFCQRCNDSFETVRNAIVGDEKRQKYVTLLRFPSDAQFNNMVFSPDSHDGEIDFDFTPFTIDDGILDDINVSMNTPSIIFWKIAFYEKEPRVVKRLGEKNKGAEKFLKNVKTYKGNTAPRNSTQLGY